jgi:curved DNA-binding protein CbpA
MNLENPFDILRASAAADDAAIHAAYVAAVRRHPPDRDPAGFKRVRAAYDLLKNKDERLSLRLFGRALAASGTPSEWLAAGAPPKVFTGPGPWLKAVRAAAASTDKKT